IPTLRITSRDNMAAFTAGVLDKKEASNAIHRQGVRKAMEAGVNIALGSHAPGPRSQWKLGESTAVELLELVQCGMSPLRAISAGTLQAARAYGSDDRLGSLQSGKQADIIVLDGDPSIDPALLRDSSRLKLVFQRGRLT